jgi:signal transduction histidine kinase
VGSKIGTVLAVPLLALVAVGSYLALVGDYRSSAIVGGIILVSIVIAVIAAKPPKDARPLKDAKVPKDTKPLKELANATPPPARLEATVALPIHKVAQRAEVSAMFANLARRSSRLVDALIERLDHAEADEADPDRLAQLFDFDHLATRMRHANDSLLVLAGSDASRAREHPIPLLDILRAGQSQIEQYKRVEYGRVDGDVAIGPHAIDAVVHVLAELLDNGTRYSPAERPVMIEGRRTGDGATVTITDNGIGVGDGLDMFNARLAEPPELGVAESRSMGLAVVAHLARRYGLTVRLRAEPGGGTAAVVELPADLVRFVAPVPSPRLSEFVVLPRPLERSTALPGGEPLEVPIRRPAAVNSRNGSPNTDEVLPRRAPTSQLGPHGRVLANGHAVGVAHVIPSALEQAPQEVAPDEARDLLSSFQRALERVQDRPAEGEAS